jgi:hypothetical protein
LSKHSGQIHSCNIVEPWVLPDINVPRLQQHVFINKQLNISTTKHTIFDMSSIQNITKAPTPEVARQILKVANDSALDYAGCYSFNYMAWCRWDASRRIDTSLFEDYLRAVSSIYNRLRRKLYTHVDKLVRDYRPTVKLMCATQAAGQERHHAIVALCFDSFAIVIDPALHPTAFRVLLDDVCEMHPYIPISGPEGQERFKYFLEDGKYKLTMDNKDASYEPVQFFELSGDDELTRLVATIEKDYDDDRKNNVLPASKHISFRSFLDKKPRFIAAEPVDDDGLATTVRIRVDFAEPRTVMQIPSADYQLSNLRLCVPAPKGFRLSATDKTVLFEQKLYAVHDAEPKQELKGLEQLMLVGLEFGLDCNFFDNACRSVYKVWDPIRPKYSR